MVNGMLVRCGVNCRITVSCTSWVAVVVAACCEYVRLWTSDVSHLYCSCGQWTVGILYSVSSWLLLEAHFHLPQQFWMASRMSYMSSNERYLNLLFHISSRVCHVAILLCCFPLHA
jgi:hypothetical protein